MKTLLGENKLTYKTLASFVDERHQFRLSPEAEKRIVKCRDYLDHKIGTIDKPIYGITTGFGSLCDKIIPPADLNLLQRNLVMSHACGTGNEIDCRTVRLMLILKIHALSLGHSGICLETVNRMIDFLNLDILPVVYDRGSLGASGDLAPLAALAMPLTGEGNVRYKGEIRRSADVLNETGLKPVELRSKEGLALLNGTQFMSAHGVYAMLECFKLNKIADIVGALSLDAYCGSIEPFLPYTHRVRAHAGSARTAVEICRLLEGSELMSVDKKTVQDPYSFRCIPQVHGAVKDATAHAADVISKEINSVTDNPIIFPDEDLIVSGGNFHGEPIALVFDYAGIALSELGNISERRVAQLILGKRGLPDFLVSEPGLNSGFMIPQYTAAAMVSQNKNYASPASVDSIVSSNGQEDHVSMGANGAVKLLKIIDNVKRILAIELMAATQALEFRRPKRTSPYLESFTAEYRKHVSFARQDRFFGADIAKTVAFLENYKFDPDLSELGFY